MVWVCGRSLAGISVSNPAGGTEVSLVRFGPLRLLHHGKKKTSAPVWAADITVNMASLIWYWPSLFQYLGEWYELYRIPNAAEDDLTCEAEQLFKTENGIGIQSVAYNTRWDKIGHVSTLHCKFILISTFCILQRTVICCMSAAFNCPERTLILTNPPILWSPNGGQVLTNTFLLRVPFS